MALILRNGGSQSPDRWLKEPRNNHEKQEKWPANAREQILDTLCECVEKFEKNPSYKTREVLLSLTCEHDLNLNENSGLVRVTE